MLAQGIKAGVTGQGFADVACAEQADAADLQPRTLVDGAVIVDRLSGQPVRQYRCLRQARCQQANGLAVDFGAFTQRADGRIGSTQLAVNQNAFAACQACRGCQPLFRHYASGNNHPLRRQCAAII